VLNINRNFLYNLGVTPVVYFVLAAATAAVAEAAKAERIDKHTRATQDVDLN